MHPITIGSTSQVAVAKVFFEKFFFLQPIALKVRNIIAQP